MEGPSDALTAPKVYLSFRDSHSSRAPAASSPALNELKGPFALISPVTALKPSFGVGVVETPI